MVSRRQFLARMAAAAGGLVAGGSVATARDLWLEDFQQASHDWLLGYRSASQSDFNAEVQITGEWPDELRGALFRNGPAQHEIGGYRYHHWFDGDGMVQRFQADNNRLSHQAKMVATRKRAQEQSMGRAVVPTFGSVPPDPRGMSSSDDINPANISLLWHQQKLFALWEAGSPYEISPADLTTRGLHQFSPESAGVPFSAHPRVEADGTIWNFGYASGSGRLVFWHISADGEVKKLKPLDVGNTSIPHDFVITERYLVILLAPFHRDPEADRSEGFLGMHRWYPDRATRVMILDKNSLELVQEMALPAQWIFHFGNAYEDGPNVIRFDAARYDNTQVVEQTLRDVMRGRWTPSPHAQWYEYTLDLNRKRASETPALETAWGAEFPAFDRRQNGRRHDRMVMLTSDTLHPGRPGDLRQVSCLHRDQQTVDSFRFADHYMVEEHLLVPDLKSPLEPGWVMGTALNLKNKATEIQVFRADALSDGPVASARLPYALPLGLHGTYIHQSQLPA